jgi:hypothetical protein
MGPAFVFAGLLAALFVIGALFPSAGPRLGMGLLVLSLLLASLVSVRRQRDACRRGAITRRVFLRNVLVEVTGAGGAMVLAAMLGSALAAIVTAGMPGGHDMLVRFAVGCGTGLLAGLVVGMLVSRSWGRLARMGRGEPAA